jgi:hypothetical protein
MEIEHEDKKMFVFELFFDVDVFTVISIGVDEAWRLLVLEILAKLFGIVILFDGEMGVLLGFEEGFEGTFVLLLMDFVDGGVLFEIFVHIC